MNAHNIPLSKLPAIKPGCFLVIHGEQGAGKSTIARRVASSRGRYAEVSSQHLNEPNVLADALSSLPSTLIINDEGFRREDLVQLKALVTSKHIHLRRAYNQKPEKMLVPPVIVCSQDVQEFCDMRRAQLFLVHKD